MAKICLCLTGKTLDRNLEILQKYRNYIDIAELRVDYLNDDEHFHIRRFPALAGIPVILTVRRNSDGGNFYRGESARIILLSKGLAFAETDRRLNFAYVDLEEDLNIPGLEEAARAFGTRIIRSFHNMTGADTDLANRIKSLSRVGDEIVKAAVTPQSLDDVVRVFQASRELQNPANDKLEKILLCMGDVGSCTRILSEKLGSYLTYATPKYENDFPLGASGQFDPKELVDFYRFREIKKDTAIFGITGYPLTATSSPAFFNAVFARTGRNAVYLRFPSEKISSFIALANEIGILGASVTVPHKETLLDYVTHISDEVKAVGACNTIIKTPNGWSGYNTDTRGFSDSLLTFIGKKDFKGMRVTVVGAGGAARAVVAELSRLKAKVLIVNRDVARAEQLAQKYNFEYDSLNEYAEKSIRKYSSIIIQTTSLGMEPEIGHDPLSFYHFTGKETVMDIIYKPERTHLLNRAATAGCHVINGFDMLTRQAKYQYKHFLNEPYPEEE